MIRLAIMFGTLLVAFLIGSATHSVNVFIVVVAIGLVGGIVLRLTLLR